MKVAETSDQNLELAGPKRKSGEEKFGVLPTPPSCHQMSWMRQGSEHVHDWHRRSLHA